MKFTFKKEPPFTGLMSVGNPHQSVEVKHRKKIVGMIHAPNWETKDRKWGVSFMVKRGDNNFDRRRVKRRFETETEARQWIQENAEKIHALNLYYMEPNK